MLPIFASDGQGFLYWPYLTAVAAYVAAFLSNFAILVVKDRLSRRQELRSTLYSEVFENYVKLGLDPCLRWLTRLSTVVVSEHEKGEPSTYRASDEVRHAAASIDRLLGSSFAYHLKQAILAVDETRPGSQSAEELWNNNIEFQREVQEVMEMLQWWRQQIIKQPELSDRILTRLKRKAIKRFSVVKSPKIADTFVTIGDTNHPPC